MPGKHSEGRFRIFAEDVPSEQLLRPCVIRALLERSISLVVSVRPPTLADMRRALPRLQSAGVDLAVWPMLDDLDGRWANLGNLPTFLRFAEQVLDDLANEGTLDLGPLELVLDFEPPIRWVRRALAGAIWRPPVGRSEPLANVRPQLARLHQRCRAITCAAVPSVLFESAAGPHVAEAWSRLLSVPDPSEPDLAPFIDRVYVMLYSSLLQGYSRGWLRRADALALLHQGAMRASDAHGPRACVALGTVGGGALGTERPYTSPAELAADVAVARAAGVRDLALFDLGGVLRRPHMEAWLDAFVAPSVSPQPPDVSLTWRSRVVLGTGRAIGRLLPRARP